MTCPLCFEEFQLMEVMADFINCGHYACGPCRKNWIMSQIENRTLPIRCFGCLAQSPDERTTTSLWPDAYIRLTISPHLFGLYLTTLLSIWSTSSPDARHCNTPNCKGLTFIFPVTTSGHVEYVTRNGVLFVTKPTMVLSVVKNCTSKTRMTI